jgi:hypothetical protein
MKSPDDKSIGYAGAVVACAVVIFLIIGVIVGLITGV